MFTFILVVILAIFFGYFATQNTQDITLTLSNYSIPQIPLYIVLGITLVIGLGVAWIISLSGTISSALTLRGKDSTIKHAKTNINDLTKRINQLEIENAKLKGEAKNEHTDDTSL